MRHKQNFASCDQGFPTSLSSLLWELSFQTSCCYSLAHILKACSPVCMVGMREVGLSGGSEVIMTVPLKEIFRTLTFACLSAFWHPWTKKASSVLHPSISPKQHWWMTLYENIWNFEPKRVPFVVSGFVLNCSHFLAQSGLASNSGSSCCLSLWVSQVLGLQACSTIPAWVFLF